jgi:photosystem II stability/assembly factor-like uncharacterized protein
MKIKHGVNLLTTGLGIAFACASVPSFAVDAEQAQLEYSVIAKLADQSLLLAGTATTDKLVVVGSRGHILVSQDMGGNWTQAKVPSRVALTSVYFADENNGWAVGHDAIIVRTTDGGLNWERVHYAPEQEKPLLAIRFNVGGSTGFAYGAYGYVLKSMDSGQTWQEQAIGDADGEPDDFHLNAVAQAKTGTLYLAAEAGAAYKSINQGESWERMYAAYEGSFFGVLPLVGDSLLMYGLQGNVFRSDDAGESWVPIDTNSTATLNGGAVLKDGTIVIVGNEGVMLVSKTGGHSFMEKNLDDRKAISDVVPTQDGGAMLVGDMGVRKLSLAQLN